MAVQDESKLQTDIQELVIRRGGYVKKNHGSMISEPGVSDLTVCYKGLYLSIEVKIDGNEPTRQQGIHCRKVNKAGGISAIVWNIEDVDKILDIVHIHALRINGVLNEMKYHLDMMGVDDGTKY